MCAHGVVLEINVLTKCVKCFGSTTQGDSYYQLGTTCISRPCNYVWCVPCPPGTGQSGSSFANSVPRRAVGV